MKRACSTLIARIQLVPKSFTNTHKILFSIFLGLSLWSCSNSDQPENLIPQQKMQNILMDMHLIESRSFRIPNGDSSKQVTKASYQFIFKKYKIDTAQLRSSLEYYLSKPEIMDKMYEEMLDSLSKRQSQLVKANRPTLDTAGAKKPAKSHSVKDSIKRVRDSVMNRFHIKKSPVKK